MICSHFQAVSCLAFLAASGLASAQQLSKPALRENLEYLNLPLTYALPSAKYTQQVWPFGQIAEPCKFEAQQNNLSPTTIFTYNVTYQDCAVPYVFCFHRDFPTKLEDAAFIFGKVPPRMRQYVRTISFLPGGGDAYARGPDIVMRGSHTTVGVYIHELTHATEWSDGFYDPALMSSSQSWANGYNQDTAVPDNYARTNQVENLAQHPMFILYNDNIRDITLQEPNYNRISGQQFILRVEAQNGKNGGDLFKTSGVGCTFRHPFARNVSPVSTASTQSTQSTQSTSDYHESANATYATSQREYKVFGISAIDPNKLSNVEAKKTECKFR